MARVCRDDAHDSNTGNDSNRPLGRRATTTTATHPQEMPAREPIATTAGTQISDQPQPMDLKALRLAVHGWWLGNPLVYKPGIADLMAVARELAGAGAASGTLVLSDVSAGSDRATSDSAGTLSGAEAIPHDSVQVIHGILILRPPIPRAALSTAVAETIAEVAQTTLGRPCSVRWRRQVVLREGGRVAVRLGRVSTEEYEGTVLVHMRLALGGLRQAAQNNTDQMAAALFARPDWREVFLARLLHALDGRLRALQGA